MYLDHRYVTQHLSFRHTTRLLSLCGDLHHRPVTRRVSFCCLATQILAVKGSRRLERCLTYQVWFLLCVYNFLNLFYFTISAEPVQPIQEKEYELPEQAIPTSPPSPPPPRPTKSQPPPPVEDTPPAVPPPRPSKPQIPVPPTPDQDDMYEIADTPGDTSDLPPPPPPAIEEEECEMPESSPAPPPMRPPKIPQPQAPLSSDAPQTEKRKSNCRVTLLIQPFLI